MAELLFYEEMRMKWSFYSKMNSIGEIDIYKLLAFYTFGFEHIIKKSCTKSERSIINIKLNVFIEAVTQLKMPKTIDPYFCS